MGEDRTNKSQRYVYIDALRGIAAFYVLIFHFHGQIAIGTTTRHLPDFARAFLRHGDLGVQIFFVLSGFVIAYSVREAWVTPKFVGKFAFRRAIRLDPPYWILILGNYAIARVKRGPLGAEKGLHEIQVVLANFFYLDNLLEYPSVVKVGWTLCYEIQFYLTYIILFGVMQHLIKHAGSLQAQRWARAVVFGPLLIWSFAAAAGITKVPLPGLSLGSWFMFFAGVVTFWAVYERIHAGWVAAYFAAMGLVLLVKFNMETLVAGLTAASIWAVHKRGALKTALNWRVLQYLGKISYSLYLVHPTVGLRIIRFMKNRIGTETMWYHEMAMFVVATIASLIASHLLWRVVESPAQRLAKRVSLPKRAEST